MNTPALFDHTQTSVLDVQDPFKCEFQNQRSRYFTETPQELMRKGFTIFDSDIPKGRKIERSKIYVEGNVEAQFIEAQQGSILVQGSVIGARARASEDIHIRDGVVRNSLLIALNNTVYVQGNIESGTKIVAKKIVAEGAVVGSLLLADEIIVSDINGTQVYGKTIKIGKATDKYGDNLIICHTYDYESLISDINYSHEKQNEFTASLHELEMKIIESVRTLGNLPGATAYLQVIAPKVKQGIILTPTEVVRTKKALEIVKQAKNIETLRGLKEGYAQKIRGILEFREERMDSLRYDQQSASVFVGGVSGNIEVFSIPSTQYTSLNLEDVSNLYTLLQESWTCLHIKPDGHTGVIDWTFNTEIKPLISE